MARPSRRSRGTVTVQDVAREVGVSAMTVSRVVNGGTNVRATTRAAVLEAIERLNYSPNSAARSLAAGDATQIGLLYSNPSDAYLSQFLIGALAAARRAGCHLVLEACESDRPDGQAEATRAFAATEVEGVILPCPLSEAAPVQAELAAAGIPAVSVAIGVAVPGTLNVRIDDFAAASEMTRYLLGLGHRSIGFIRGNPNQSSSLERYRGFVAALEEAGLSVKDMPVEQGYFTFRSGIIATERLLDRPNPPTAIFACNDDMAAAAVGVAHRRGLQGAAGPEHRRVRRYPARHRRLARADDDPPADRGDGRGRARHAARAAAQSARRAARGGGNGARLRADDPRILGAAAQVGARPGPRTGRTRRRRQSQLALARRTAYCFSSAIP